MGRYPNDVETFCPRISKVLLKKSKLVIWRTFLSSEVASYRSTSSSSFFPLKIGGSGIFPFCKGKTQSDQIRSVIK